MVNHVFKDNCVPLIRLHHYSYYSLGRIARLSSDHQGIPNDDGVFHISVFTKRVLGRICETWLKRMVAKDIHVPRFLHPTSSCHFIRLFYLSFSFWSEICATIWRPFQVLFSSKFIFLKSSRCLISIGPDLARSRDTVTKLSHPEGRCVGTRGESPLWTTKFLSSK